MSAITKPSTWTCPGCGAARQATTAPHHRHDGVWVRFAQGAAEAVKPRRGRPRKAPAEPPVPPGDEDL